MISVRNINKTFGKQQVLFDVSADFQSGRVNLIIGQSGQGKSVLAKSMVGLHEVDSGQILFDGRDFTSMDKTDRSEIRQEIGMLFQGSALFDSMTVEENIRFPMDMFTTKTAKENKYPFFASVLESQQQLDKLWEGASGWRTVKTRTVSAAPPPAKK